ncbi:MAG: M67 family peptidase [Nitrospirae bacterium]|nr:MAG: M67 family peptidase [Nitrospirota bacterium]
MHELNIPKDLFDRMLFHSRGGYPNEVCGILAGIGNTASALYETTNAEPSPVSYLMDPAEQFRIMKDIRQKGLRMLAIYHSHPQSPPYPSSKDIGLAFYDDVFYMIVGLIDQADPDVKIFRITEGSVSESAVVLV